MSEDTNITTGVEDTAAAGQDGYTELSYESLSGSAEGTPETGVEPGQEKPAAESPAAGDNTEETVVLDAKTETAFAKKLNAEREKIRAEISEQIAQQAQQAVYQQLKPLLEMAEYEAARHGMTPLQWAQAVQANRTTSYQVQLQQWAEELGVDPSMLTSLIEGHPDVVQGRQLQQQFQQQNQQLSLQQRMEKEKAEFTVMFPEVKFQDIPPEVFQVIKETGLPLVDAYLRVNHKTMAEKARVDAEQAAIKALKQNASGTPGTLGSEQAAPMKKTAWDLSDEEFAKLQQRVMAGEKIKI